MIRLYDIWKRALAPIFADVPLGPCFFFDNEPVSATDNKTKDKQTMTTGRHLGEEKRVPQTPLEYASQEK
jgi:hypothetical protein